MRFGFLNNFAAQLAAPVADDATEIELSTGAEAIATALENADAVALTLFVVDAQGNETKREVVYATAVTESVLAVEREQEGSTAATFTAGDGVESRLTAGSLGFFLSNTASDPGAFAVGDVTQASGINTVTIGLQAETVGENNIAIGFKAKANVDAIWAVALGVQTKAEGTQSVSIGSASSARGVCSTAIGASATANGDNGIAMGQYTEAAADKVVCLGYDSYSYSENAVVIGSACYTDAIDSVYIGHGIDTSVAGGFYVSALSYLPATAATGTAPSATKRASQQVVVSTPTIDLSSGTAAAELALPPNTLLLPDTFDVVVVESNSPGGSPEVQIGPDDAAPADYLAPTPISKTSVGGREVFEPLSSDGITTLRASVVTAGTGTLSVKIVVRGYVMEI